MRNMRRMGFLVCAALLVGVSAASAKLPRDVDEFRERQRTEATKPDGAVKLWFEAIYLYSAEGTRDAGRKMLNLAMVDEQWEKNTYFVDRLRTKAHIFRSYAKGATPDNAYKMDPNEFALSIVTSQADTFREGAWRVMLQSSGSDKARPVVLVKGNDGLWKVQTYNDIYGDVQAPK